MHSKTKTAYILLFQFMMILPEVLFSESIAIKSVQISHVGGPGQISVNAPEKVYQVLKDEYKFFPAGIGYIEKTLQAEGESPHIFWLATSETEMISVLRQGVKLSEKKIILNSLRRRSYSDAVNTVILTGDPPDVSRMFRFVFSQSALHVMDKSEFYSKEKKIPWFYYGFSSYIGFQAAQTARGEETAKTDVLFKEYYASFYKHKVSKDFSLPSDQSSWSEAYRKDPSGAFAEISLAYLYFNQKYGLAKAVELFRKYNETGKFPNSFKEVTGDSYEKFLSSLNKEFPAETAKVPEEKK